MTNMAKGAMCQKFLRWKCPICHIGRNSLSPIDNPLKVKMEEIIYLFGRKYCTHLHLIVRRLLVARLQTGNGNVSRTILVRYLTRLK